MNKKITKRALNARLHPILLGLGCVPAALFGTAAHADINVDTTVTVPGGQSSPWNVGSLLRVGNNATGRLTISSAGIVTSTSGQIGFAPTADGLVTVTGAGSAWNMTGALTVGMFGRGELQLLSGAALTTVGLGSVAEVVGSTGLVGLDGNGTTWTNAGGLYVGREGSGSLSITGGARVDVNGLIVGQGSNAVGSLVVSGSGSRLVDTDTTTIGTFGRGTARVEAGATAQTQSLMIGFADKNSGATITGAGSSWSVGGAVYVGFQGSGSLALADGGKLSSATGSIGTYGTATGSVTLSGAGTNWTTTGAVRIGDGGNGALTISNGASFNTTNSLLAFGKTGTATVTGAGSTWTDSGSLTIGLTSQARLDVLDGGTVNVGNAGITSAAGSSGTLLVSGAGSLFNASGTVYLGRTGATGVATLTDGGTLRTGSGFNSVTMNGGTLNIGAAADAAAAAAGTLDTGYVHFGGSSQLVLNHTSNDLTLATSLNSNTTTGPSIVQLAGTTRLTGNSYGYTAGVSVRGGTLLVDGAIRASSVDVAAGGRLGGSGYIAGTVSVANGGTLVAAQGKTLGLGGLSLADGAHLAMTLGAPGTQALVSVYGDLRLAGSLDLSSDGVAFGSGVYRLIDYSGALTGPGLALGALPAGLAADNAAVQTAVAQQVNLVIGNGAANQPGLQFWNAGKTAADGSIASGAGTWSAAGTNWTNASGVQTSAWAGGMAVFQGSGDAVTLDGPITATGLQFAGNGYSLGGSALNLAAGDARIRVGDGTTAGSAIGATIGSAIGGSGRLVKSDLGTLILTADNGHTGGTRIEAGTLQIARDAQLGAAAGGLAIDGGQLRLTGALVSARAIEIGSAGAWLDTQTHAATLSGAVTGAGTLTKQGSGTLTIAGDASGITGTAEIGAGTLRVDGTLGAGAVRIGGGAGMTGTGTLLGTLTVADGARLGSNQGQTLTLGALSLADTAHLEMRLGAPGSQALVKVNGDLRLAGSLDLTSDGAAFGSGVYRLIDYTGGLTGPGLAFGMLPAGFSAGNAAVQTAVAHQVNLVVGNGAADRPGVQFWNGAKPAADGGIGAGAGTWSATGSNWTGANGTQTAAWAGGMAVFQGNGGAVVLDGPITVTGLQFAGSGYSLGGGALNLAAGDARIRVGDGTAAGSAMTSTITANIEGAGRLVKTDLGTLILAGIGGYTGGTSINAGTLQIAGDASLGATGGGLALDGGTLKLGGALTSARVVQFGAGGATIDTNGSDALFSGAIAGTGGAALTKRGAGMLTFAGTGAGLGTTTVEAGILRIDGGFGAPVLVQAGAQLQGRGTVGSTTVASGAVVAPGNSIGTLTINGDFVQKAGSFYRVELAPNGQTDRLEVSGRATLEGGTLSVAKAAGTYAPGSRFTVLHAGGGLTGSYTSFEQDQPFVDFKLSYGANDLVLEVRRNDVNFCDVSAGANQCAVARSAQKLGDGKRVYDAIVALPSVTAAQQAFDVLSGEVHAAARTAILEDGRLLREALTTRLRGASSAAVDGWTGWAHATGITGRNAGDGNAAELEREHRGVQAGGDFALGQGWRVGAAVALGRIDVDVSARRSSAKVDGRQVALYLGHRAEALGLRLGFVQSRYSIDSHRAIAFANFSEQADARYTSSSRQLFGELGWRVELGSAELEPFAALAATHLGGGRFAETGAADAALNGSTGKQDLTLASLGMRGHVDWSLAAGTLRLQGALAWQRAGGAARQGAAELAFAAGGPAYGVTGAALARNSAVADLGLSLRHGANSSFGVAYAGQWSGQSRDHGLRLSAEHRF